MRKPLKVLIVGDFLPDVGGVSQYVLNLATFLIKFGHEVAIFHTKPGLDRNLGILYIYRLPHSLFLKLKYILKGLVYVIEFIKISPLVIIRPKLLLTMLIYAGKLSEIVEKTKVQVIHSNHLAIRSLVACHIAKKKNALCIITAHGYDTEYPPNKLEYFIRKKCIDMASKVIVPTLWKALRIIKLYSAGDVATIPNFIPCYQLNKISFHSKTAAKQFLGYGNKVVITFIGRISREKGVFDIIEVARNLKARNPDISNKVVFIIAGAGPVEQELIKSINSNELPDLVSYAGKVIGTLKSNLLLASDIFLLPTTYYETFPIALIEAMSHGAIPVVYYFPGVQEILKHGEEGFVLSQGNIQDLLSIIEHVFLGEISIHQMQLKALHRAKKYCAESVVPSIVNIYWESLYEKRS